MTKKFPQKTIKLKNDRQRFTPQEIRKFWNSSMKHLPSYHDAPSTKVYRQEEIQVIKKFLAPIKDTLFLKTDLWNEVKNTRILHWASEQGAITVAFDISDRVTLQARESFSTQGASPLLCVADIRHLPYLEKSFDRLYSMGTAEHTPDYIQAFQELFRVLKPGGKAVIGVPNKFDPFLRPIFVWILQKIRLYSFGYEKSFSRSELTHYLTKIGFKITGQSSILLMPGFLRMADLFLYSQVPRLAFLTRGLVKFFHYLYQKSRLFQRHGYLLAVGVERPFNHPPGNF